MRATAAAAPIRIVTLSATLPNSRDVAEWLQAAHFSFDASYRPGPIDRVVLGFPNAAGKNPFLFEKYLNYKWRPSPPPTQSLRRHPALLPPQARPRLLLHTQGMHVASSPLSPAAPSPTSSLPTATATDWLRTASSAPSCSRGLSPSPLPPSLQQYLPRVQDASLRAWLQRGIAIHTAGLGSPPPPFPRS